jgi:hypothetical protein
VGLWLALDCLDNEAVAAGVLICSNSQWALNALKESGHSAHSVLAPLRACLRVLNPVRPGLFLGLPARRGAQSARKCIKNQKAL